MAEYVLIAGLRPLIISINFGGMGMKRVISLLFVLLFVFAAAVSASALDYGCNVSTVSEAVYLENLDTGTAVFEKNASERMYPASTTKIMTYIIVAENVPDFDGTKVEITESALSNLDPESSVMGLEEHIGEQFSVKDLLYGLMLPSGNDAALVLADFVGHGIDGFVDLMNRKAAQLGCESTHFVNPHGLYHSNHYSTARDMAVITKYAMQKQSFLEIVGTVQYTPSGFDEPIYNTNYLLDESAYDGRYYYPYAQGVKTGFTDEAGRCLVSLAEHDGYTYLCVALGAAYSYVEDVNYAMLDSKSLYSWAFDSLATQTVYSASEAVTNVPVNYVWGNQTVSLVPAKDVVALLPNDYDTSLVTTGVECVETVDAPVAAGDVLGSITVYYDDVLLGTTDAVAADSIDRDELNYILHRIVRAIKNHVLLFVILLGILILIIVFIVMNIRARKAAQARRRFR